MRGVGNDPIWGCTDYFSLIVRQNMSAVSIASDCIVRTVDASIILMLAPGVVVDYQWKFRHMWSQWLLSYPTFLSLVYSLVLASVGFCSGKSEVYFYCPLCGKGNAIGRVRPFFLLYLLNQLTLSLIFCSFLDHYHSSLGIESQGHKSRSSFVIVMAMTFRLSR